MTVACVRKAARDWTNLQRERPVIVVQPRLWKAIKCLGRVLALLPLLWALCHGLLIALGTAKAALALSLAGSSAVHISSRPSRKDILATAVTAVALRTLYVWFIGPIGSYFGSVWISWGSFLGVASLLTLAARALTAGDTRRKIACQSFWGAIAFLYFWFIGAVAMQLTARTIPLTLDRFLYVADSSLGFEPSFAAGSVLAGLPLLLRNLTWLQYEALMLAVAIVYAWQRMRSTDNSPKILSATVSMAIVGFLLYYLYPAAGPVYGFGSLFPHRPPEALQLALMPMPLDSAARNAMPSLHMGMSLLVWWHSRGSRWVGRWLAGLFLLATAFSTMAKGEHYLIDLIVAFPFAMAIQALWATVIPFTARARYLPLVKGTLMTFAWLALLRFGVHWLSVSPVIPWLLVSSTVVYSWATETKLAAVVHKIKQCSNRPEQFLAAGHAAMAKAAGS